MSLGLPFALHLSGAAGKAWPDLRMQLIQLQLSRGPRRASSSVQHGAGGSWGLLHRDAEGPDSPSLVGPTACLMLAFIMFPDQVGPLINRLWPAGALALAGPRAARQGLKWAKAARQGSRRRHPGPPAADPTEGQPDSTSDHPESWAQARAFGRMLQPLGQAVRVLAGPAALLRGGALLLEALAPPGVISTSQALLGLLAVMFQVGSVRACGTCDELALAMPCAACTCTCTMLARFEQLLCMHLDCAATVLHCTALPCSTTGWHGTSAVGALSQVCLVGWQLWWGCGLRQARVWFVSWTADEHTHADVNLVASCSRFKPRPDSTCRRTGRGRLARRSQALSAATGSLPRGPA